MKTTIKTTALAMMMIFSANTNASAQSTAEKLLNAISSYETKREAAKKEVTNATKKYQDKKQNASAALSSAASKIKNGASSLKSGAKSWIGGLISSKLIPSKTQIAGTWIYERPAIVFTSQNALTNLGGSAASAAIENKLQSTLSKHGMSKGNMSLTFNNDGTFKVSYKNHTSEGKYTVKDDKVSMTFNGMSSPCKMTPQLNDGTLIIATDATKIKDFLQGIGSKSTSDIAAITAMLKKFNGMQLGIRMNKK